MLKNTNKRNFHIISRNIVEFALTWSAFGRCDGNCDVEYDENCDVECDGNCDKNDYIFCVLYHGLNDINGRNNMKISTQYPGHKMSKCTYDCKSTTYHCKILCTCLNI